LLQGPTGRKPTAGVDYLRSLGGRRTILEGAGKVVHWAIIKKLFVLHENCPFLEKSPNLYKHRIKCSLFNKNLEK
jgi:hypothetical protein